MPHDEIDSLSDETFRDMPRFHSIAGTAASLLTQHLAKDPNWQKQCEETLVWMMVVAGDFRRIGFTADERSRQELRTIIEDTLLVTAEYTPRGALGVVDAVLKSAESFPMVFTGNPFETYTSVVNEIQTTLYPERLCATIGRAFALLCYCQSIMVSAALRSPP